MTDTLSEICAKKREHITRKKKLVTLAEILEEAKAASPARGFKKALEAKIAQEKFALIAEVKKASPSKGVIRADFNPATLAKAYANAGAACVSVLTDEPYFQGHDSYLMEVRAEVKLPVLRKDFMLEPYQIVESRALGADCILLIMAALSDAQASELEKIAFSLGMDVLVEVHDEAELERALAHLQSTLIGINNRNLKTLKVDISTSELLAKKMPEHILPVCESGIGAHEDLERMKRAGIECFLVGESLMREDNVELATRKLLGGS